MSLTDLVRGPKTYEMLPGANCTNAHLRNAASIKGLETCFKYVDVRVNATSPPDPAVKAYDIQHVNDKSGWYIQLKHPDGLGITQVLSSITGVKHNEERVGGITKIVIKPRYPVRLYDVAGFIDDYESGGLKPRITGFRIEKLPRSLYKRATKIGLQLRKVKS